MVSNLAFRGLNLLGWCVAGRTPLLTPSFLAGIVVLTAYLFFTGFSVSASYCQVCVFLWQCTYMILRVVMAVDIERVRWIEALCCLDCIQLHLDLVSYYFFVHGARCIFPLTSSCCQWCFFYRNALQRLHKLSLKAVSN